MLLEGVRAARLTPEERREALEEEAAVPRLGKHTLLLQGIATSIDALSVGFTIAEYDFLPALVESFLIGLVTFLLCFLALRFGRVFGQKLAWRAPILGGVILCAVGVEIFVTGI